MCFVTKGFQHLYINLHNTTAISFFADCSREIGEDPRVKTAANIFKNLCYKYRDGVSAGIICAGWDKYNGGQVTCMQ